MTKRLSELAATVRRLAAEAPELRSVNGLHDYDPNKQPQASFGYGALLPYAESGVSHRVYSLPAGGEPFVTCWYLEIIHDDVEFWCGIWETDARRLMTAQNDKAQAAATA